MFAAFAAAVLAGCDNGNGNDDFDGWVGVPTISVTPAEATVGIEGDDVVVSVETEAPWALEIPETLADVTADVLEGNGAQMVTVTVPAYDGVKREIELVFRAWGYNNGTLEEQTATLVITQTDGGTVINDNLIEYDDHIVYYDDTYRTATLSDSKV